MREIRLSGSVRGVWRKPYPYRDHLASAASAARSLRAVATSFKEREADRIGQSSNTKS
jgi:hypothetical protein